MSVSDLVQDLIDKLNETEEKSKSSIPIEQIIENTHFNLESQINLNKFKRILIIGMGGGCDVFSAFSYYKYLSNHFAKRKQSKTKKQASPVLLFGNCTSIRNDLKKHKSVCNYLYEVHTHRPFAENADNKHYGTTRLEQSIPTKYDKETNIFNGPYLLVPPIKEFSAQINNIKLATFINNEVMSECYKYLEIELIIGIDNGGDSLTCGIDFKNDPELARDRQVLYSMKNNKYNIPYIHFVFGPGCDGESTMEQLTNSIQKKENRFLGSFQLSKEIMDVMRDRAKLLTDMRTPNIMYSAFSKSNDAQNEEKRDDNKNEMVTIPRGRKPRIQIPRHWLYACWVFSTKIEELNKNWLSSL